MHRFLKMSAWFVGALGVFLAVCLMGGFGRGYTPEELRRVESGWRSVESLALVDEGDPQRVRASVHEWITESGSTDDGDLGRLGEILAAYGDARRDERDRGVSRDRSLRPGPDESAAGLVWIDPAELRPATRQVLDDFGRWLPGEQPIDWAFATDNVLRLLELADLTLAVHGRDARVVGGVLELAHSLRTRGTLSHTRVGLVIGQHALRRSVRAGLPLGDAFRRFAPTESELAPLLAREAVWSAEAVECVVEDRVPEALRGLTSGTRDFVAVVARDLLVDRMDHALTADPDQPPLPTPEALGPVELALGVAFRRPEACKALLEQHTVLALDGLDGHVREFRRSVAEFEGALASGGETH